VEVSVVSEFDGLMVNCRDGLGPDSVFDSWDDGGVRWSKRHVIVVDGKLAGRIALDVALLVVVAVDLPEIVRLEAEDELVQEVENLDGRRVRQRRQIERQGGGRHHAGGLGVLCGWRQLGWVRRYKPARSKGCKSLTTKM
jgi:hypothetical protein